jgi:chromosome segregation ATPase
MLAQQLSQIEASTKERQQLKDDIGLLATSIDTAGNAGVGSADLARYDAEVARLGDEVARLSALQGTSNPELATLKGTIALSRAETAQLNTKIQSLETAINSLKIGAINTSPRGRLVLALGRLKDQARAGLAYGAELASLKVDIAELPALDQQLLGAEFAILSRNGDGIKSYEELARSFDVVARAVKMAQEKQDGGFLANLFTVRRTDENATGIDAILLNAEKRLAVQDVQGAVEVLSTLEGDGAATSAEWQAAATAHVETIKAIDVMIRSVAGSDTPTGGSQ